MEVIQSQIQSQGSNPIIGKSVSDFQSDFRRENCTRDVVSLWCVYGYVPCFAGALTRALRYFLVGLLVASVLRPLALKTRTLAETARGRLFELGDASMGCLQQYKPRFGGRAQAPSRGGYLLHEQK